ncbi:1,4-dihydroxy-2-naphthoate polyprenyltransferase [Vagococcus penaei]|uniref:1,4-dihydroxy-2-naphthoate polyprenyltransferase n=1 Tax=Vagococcus penaei TaxID=633807 RepID=A0A1Q2D6F1_9ENTE|nr:1,4-dihydroxy-2-naphthoate polyprenyltransferase [Vagococcus penaei]AQP53912.1 1,4-dihydroxy-2-naphthoate polyprenyltransferase [Vagococcus penaei]RSU02924.1 1,4-dihydroxy-2-naphthoate polyprenyltransferase [Vagococcus penaei]
MTVKVFLELVEIRTKLASLFPFVIGWLFSLYYFEQVNIENMILFFAAMLSFDMATTAINNLMDYKKAHDNEYQKTMNIVGVASLDVKHVSWLIYGMIAFSSVIGLILTYRTSLLLLMMGGLCFLIGIFYTFGPVPLSRMPLGEMFSGVTMGFGIFFITIYLNIAHLDIITFVWQGNLIGLYGNVSQLVAIVWASLPLIFTIANIMLANNLCDLDQDVKNHRYTLPFYLGRENGIRLFNVLMYGCYATIIIGIIFGVYHWVMFVVLLTLPKIKANTQLFTQKQIKSETFSVSIKNLVLFNGAQIIGLLLSIVLR